MKDPRPAMSAEDLKPDDLIEQSIEFLRKWIVAPSYHGSQNSGMMETAHAMKLLEALELSSRRANPPPAGEFVLVPREPTDEMLREAFNDTANDWGGDVEREHRVVWAAMLSAAPVPPAAPSAMREENEALSTIKGTGE